MQQALRRWLPWIGLVVRLVVGGVWGGAGAIKISDPAASVRAVRAYRILPEATVHAVGYGLPFLELAIGLLLILGAGTRVAAALSAALLLLFVVGIASAWGRGLQIECGCFGGGGYAADAASSYPWEIARDVGLFLGSLLLVVRPATMVSLDGWLVPEVRSVP